MELLVNGKSMQLPEGTTAAQLLQQLGIDLLRKVQEDVAEIAKIESYPRMEGRQMLMVLSPK